MSLVKAIQLRCAQGFTVGQKAVLTAAAVVYVLSPIDIVPDFLPVLGQIDDGTMLLLVIKVWISPTNPPGGSGGVRA